MMNYPRNISQFKKWAKKNQGKELFLHYDKRKAVRRYVTLVLANQSSVLFLDRDGSTFKVKYPKKNHYHFHADSFSFKTMVFKYKLPKESQSKKNDSQTIDDNSEKRIEHDVLDQKGLQLLASKMWGLAVKYGYDPKNMTLVLPYNAQQYLRTAPCDSYLMDIGEEPFTIDSPSSKDTKSFDLVIGMPGCVKDKTLESPNNSFDGVKVANQTEYYLLRGLYLIRPGGLLVYYVCADVESGEEEFLQSGMSTLKEIIAKKLDLLIAYRLPTYWLNGVTVNSEIIVFKKKRY